MDTTIILPDGKKIIISENANPLLVKAVNNVLTNMNCTNRN
jgi:uncharacterized protein YlzI (FlbEa/FlbD family)